MALPKYKKLNRSIEKMLLDEFNAASRKELGPFSESPHFVQHEGKTMAHNTIDNTDEESDMKYQQMKIEYAIKFDEITTYGPEKVFELVHEKAKDLGSQMAKYNFQVVSDTVEKVGNVVDGTGMKIGPEAMIAGFEKVSISFDKDGKAHMPTMVVSPNEADKWAAAGKELEENPVYRKRMEDLLQKKKGEYDAEQASRKLVD